MNEIPPPLPPTDSPRQICISLTGAIFTAFVADFLLWGAIPGISLGLFGLILMAAILLARQPVLFPRRVALILSLLLLGALVATAMQISFTNICILLGMFTMLAGETFFMNRPSFWARWFSQLGAIMIFPVRLFWAARSTIRILPSSSSGAIRVVAWFVGVVFPVALLTLLFSFVLGSGNAILGTWVNRFLLEAWNWITSFDFSLGRLFFWGFMAVISLSLIRPANTGRIWWGWMERTARFAPPKQPLPAYWRSILILVVLNAIFFAANSIDCFYLWAQQGIPKGVTYADYMHQGTAQLITATILSALVLIFLFNQDESISSRSSLRATAMVWIVQNIFLLTSIALRLKLYVDAYSLTAQRISVLIFLLIVAGGFIILACKIALEKSLLWLLGANAALVFTVFYCVQFLDLGAISAGYNVSRWEKNPTYPLDIAYIQKLGSSGWGALQRVAANSYAGAEASKASEILTTSRSEHSSGCCPKNWRSWQAREAWNQLYLLTSTR